MLPSVVEHNQEQYEYIIVLIDVECILLITTTTVSDVVELVVCIWFVSAA